VEARVAGYERDAQLAARETVTQIEIAQITAIVPLVVGRDAELLDFFLEIMNHLIDRSRMDRTG